MALRDEIDKIQKVLKVNEKSMVSPDRELFHSILSALKDIEKASHPKVMQVGDSKPDHRQKSLNRSGANSV
jgi:hypothetical protein